MKGTREKFFISITLLVIFIGLLIFGIKIYIEKQVMSGLSPEQKKVYDDFLTKPLNFEPAELQVQPFNSDTIQAARTFMNLWETHAESARDLVYRFQDLKGTGHSTTDTPDYEAILKELNTFSSLIEAFEYLVTRPDYEIDSIPYSLPYPDFKGIPVPDFMAIQILAKLLNMKVAKAVHEGKYHEAFDTAATIMRASRVHKYSTVLTQLIGVAVSNIATNAWYSAVAHCNDVTALKKSLRTQNSIADEFHFFPDSINPNVLDQLGILIMLRRAGIKVRIQGLTGEELAVEALQGEAEYIESKVLPLLTDTMEKEMARRMIRENRRTAAFIGGKATDLSGHIGKVASFVTKPLFVNVLLPDRSEIQIRADGVRTKFDLLRLNTARKFYMLQHTDVVTQIDDLVPEYLPEIPVDVFRKDRGAYTSEPVFYSLGPDGVDQHTAVLYDPTNGILSAGDIFFE